MALAASIDVHSHALPASYLAALAELGIDPVAEDGFPTPAWSEEGHLAFMDKTNQEFCVLSISTPHINRGSNEQAVRLASAINDELAAICARHPGRLGFTPCCRCRPWGSLWTRLVAAWTDWEPSA